MIFVTEKAINKIKSIIIDNNYPIDAKLRIEIKNNNYEALLIESHEVSINDKIYCFDGLDVVVSEEFNELSLDYNDGFKFVKKIKFDV